MNNREIIKQRLNEQRSERLRKLRGHMAFKKQVEPYIIFNDATLDLILEKEPKTMTALGKIKGFGGAGIRLEKYGQAILDCLWKADKVKDFEVSVDGDGEIRVESVLTEMKLF